MRLYWLGAMLLAATLPGTAQTPTPTTSAPVDSVRQSLRQGIASKLPSRTINTEHDARKSAGEFANYVKERTGHQLAPEFVLALADAEWRARSAGKPTISVATFSESATRLFTGKLGVAAPSTSSNGASPFYVVTPEKINAARLFYRRNVSELSFVTIRPELTDLSTGGFADPSARAAYPLEAFLALYVCVTDDLGESSTDLQQKMSERNPESAAANLSVTRRPFGERGVLVKRPVRKLLAEDVLTQLLAAPN